MELRELAGGATLLNDSFNADPDSARAALDALAAVECRRRIAVLGDMLELGDDSDWLRSHLAAGDVVLVKASRAARLDEVAAALA